MQAACRTLLLLLSFSLAAIAQDDDDRRPLDHADYDVWNTMTSRSISGDGQWVMYGVRDGKDRSTLKIRHTSTPREYTVANGSSGRFTWDGKKALYVIQPDPELVRKLRKAKKTDDIPEPKLEILDLATGDHTTVPGVSSFSLPQKNSDWVTFRAPKPKSTTTVTSGTAKATETFEVTPEGLKRTTGQKPGSKSKPTSSESGAKSGSGNSKKKSKSEGSTLVLRSLSTGLERRFPFVSSHTFSEAAERLAFATSTKDDGDADGVWVLNLSEQKATQVIGGKGNYTRLTFNKNGSQLAFLTDRDDYEAEHPSWSLYLLGRFRKQAEKIAMAGDEGIPEGWWVASSASPVFSDDDRRLFFSTAPVPEHEEKDEDAEPKAKLDLWHWKDPLLQPQQLLQAARERARSYRAVCDLRSKKLVQLATREIPSVSVDPRSSADVAVANSNEKYKQMLSWDTPGYNDIHLVDLKTGESTLVVEKVRASGRLSPEGRFITWFDPEKRQWFAMSTRDRKPVLMSRGANVQFANELHDTPSAPRSYGIAAWLKGDDAVLVYDRFDLWKLDPSGRAKAARLTSGRGDQLRYRYQRLDSEERAVDPASPLMLSVFNEQTKATGFSRLQLGEKPSVDSLIMLDESLSGLTKARHADAVMLTRSTFRRCPDVWVSSTDFDRINRISRINPQQNEYLWGTAELVHWKSADGTPLDGILYKPDNFDADRKYPLMVYFYERSSDRLHSYHTPAAGRSTINFSFYVSRGYVVFIPDIPYTTGFPGESAAKAVLPGVESILAMGFVDKDRIGMQGHSWGGYQAAYLVTQTDMFACAEAGAPVSNMTSAYGGIRWGSGMSRMFQYERTQSRIGQTLWEGRERYIANSPLFFADKINTPLLILHNDEDGAVPWYQGIELFVAMRRLSKPAWMMNYNGEPHWVMKKENRLDFAKRMQQFFDHYLQGAPEPVWMATGIPAVDKGRKFGFEPAAQPETAEESSED